MSRGERASVPELTACLHGGRDGDAVVEDEAQGLVRLGVALAAGEHVLLDVLEHGEPSAARRVRSRLAGRARRPLLDDRS